MPSLWCRSLCRSLHGVPSARCERGAPPRHEPPCLFLQRHPALGNHCTARWHTPHRTHPPHTLPTHRFGVTFNCPTSVPFFPAASAAPPGTAPGGGGGLSFAIGLENSALLHEACAMATTAVGDGLLPTLEALELCLMQVGSTLGQLGWWGTAGPAVLPGGAGALPDAGGYFRGQGLVVLQGRLGY